MKRANRVWAEAVGRATHARSNGPQAKGRHRDTEQRHGHGRRHTARRGDTQQGSNRTLNLRRPGKASEPNLAPGHPSKPATGSGPCAWSGLAAGAALTVGPGPRGWQLAAYGADRRERLDIARPKLGYPRAGQQAVAAHEAGEA